METTTSKKDALGTYMETFDFHTQLFRNALDDIAEKDAQNRLNSPANHIAWLAGSLVEERYELAKALGLNIQSASAELFANHQGIRDGVDYPALDVFRKDWETVSPLLRDAYKNLSEDDLAQKDPFDMPGGEYTIFHTIIFCCDRESYCLGQIGLFRRLLNYPPTKFM